MALISMRQMLDHAAEFGYGVPAFNVNNLEQMRAIMEAADKTDSPVIVQASAGARKYAGAPFLRHLILAAIEEFPHIPVCMHQDHGTSPDVCQRSIQLGFSSVMMDGSLGEDGKTPTDYEYNVRVTQQTVAMAHACGVSVEGELGCLGSLETGMAGEEDGIGAEGVLDQDAAWEQLRRWPVWGMQTWMSNMDDWGQAGLPMVERFFAAAEEFDTVRLLTHGRRPPRTPILGQDARPLAPAYRHLLES